MTDEVILILQGLGTVLVFAMFGVGLIGTFVPVVPGALLIWLGVLLYAAVIVGFGMFSPWVFALITLIGIVTGTAELWLPLLGAKTTGASWVSLLVGFVGGIIGTFFIPVPILGTVIGYALGFLLGEYVRARDLNKALKAAFGGFVGWGVSTAVEFGGSVLMILLFLTQTN